MARFAWILACVAVLVRLLLVEFGDPFAGLSQMLGTAVQCMRGSNPWCQGITYTLTNLWIVGTELPSRFTQTADQIAAEHLNNNNHQQQHGQSPPKSPLSEKVAIVTGASSGIGLETSRVLLDHGCHVIMAVRNVTKGEEAFSDLRSRQRQTTDTNAVAELRGQVLELDLADLDSVEAFVQKVRSLSIPLHFLVNNGGIMTLPTEVKSKQGYEMQFATNYLGHFYLTRLLEPLLMQSGTIDNPSRVVFLTSTTHHLYELHGEGGLAEDIPPSKEYHPLFNYALTKALTAVAAREYQKRWGSDAPVVALAVHPGIVPTGLSRENPQMSSLFFRLLFFMHKTISQAASTTIYTLLSHDVIQQVRKEGRFYFENNSVSKRNRERESLYTDEFGDDVWKLTTALLDGREEDFKEGLISSDKDLDKE